MYTINIERKKLSDMAMAHDEHKLFDLLQKSADLEESKPKKKQYEKLLKELNEFEDSIRTFNFAPAIYLMKVEVYLLLKDFNNAHRYIKASKTHFEAEDYSGEEENIEESKEGARAFKMKILSLEEELNKKAPKKIVYGKYIPPYIDKFIFSKDTELLRIEFDKREKVFFER